MKQSLEPRKKLSGFGSYSRWPLGNNFTTITEDIHLDKFFANAHEFEPRQTDLSQSSVLCCSHSPINTLVLETV